MSKEVSMRKLLTKGRCLFLAYDQGLEHGPTDFNDKNVDPTYIIDIGKKARVNALVFQKGIAEKYQKEIKSSKIPLILKLNGKTGLASGEPFSTQLCTVKEALALGASAVGYTIYIGSEHEAQMLEQFEQIAREAHAKGIPVIAWVYPRGKSLEGKSDRDLLAYAARVGLEIGADMVKIHWHGKKEDLQWAVKAAGKCKIVIAGGLKANEKEFLMQVKEALSIGVTGLAIGRNIWQHTKPVEITKKLQRVIWG